MITVSNDKSLKVWDELTFNLLYSYTDTCQLKKIVQLNQTKFIVATGCERFMIFDFILNSSKTIANVTNGSIFSGSPIALTLFNKTTLLLGTNGTIQVFDLNLNQSSGYKQIYDEKTIVNYFQVIDDNVFAAGLFNRYISIWNLTNQTKTTSLYHGHSVYSLLITNDRKYMISGDLYNQIVFWNMNNWTLAKIITFPAYRMIQLNDNYIVHLSSSLVSSIPIGMYVCNINNSTLVNISSKNYYTMVKLDNDLIALGTITGDAIDYWYLNDPVNLRMIKSKLTPHTATIADIQSVKGF